VSGALSAAASLLGDASRCQASGVDLGTRYVRGLKRETRACRLRTNSAYLVVIHLTVVLDFDGLHDVVAVTLLADAVVAFLAARCQPSAAAVLTHLAADEPASPFFCGASRRRGLRPAAVS